ncbi:hypothetical protein AB0L70_02480 [Kribbella sp. NPDC051952]|uniref:hypothetical protein n=1 Tax=Kribbella sp. NPDC051952 TaxID=3154851 RepID=UPI0034133D8F
MTELKDLLDEAAGDEPGITDADLSADLTRGRRALRRRRTIGVVGGTVATALVIGVGWSILPSGTTTDGTPAPAARTTPAPTQASTPTHIPGGLPNDHRGAPPIPTTPVALVANTKAFPGKITCDLIPKGWAARISYPAAEKDDWEQQEVFDPKLRNTKQYHEVSFSMVVRQVEMTDNGEGLTADKYTEAWTKLPKVRAGKKEAVITLGNSRDGRREVHVRQGKTTHLIAVANNAYNLAWDEKTLLKFAGSCHYKK